MNLKYSVLAIAISAILSILLAFFLKDTFYVVISAVPLAILKKKWAAICGFLIGFLSFMSVYLLYPFSSSVRISTVVGSVTSIPSVLVLRTYMFFTFASFLTSFFPDSSYKEENRSAENPHIMPPSRG